MQFYYFNYIVKQLLLFCIGYSKHNLLKYYLFIFIKIGIDSEYNIIGLSDGIKINSIRKKNK